MNMIMSAFKIGQKVTFEKFPGLMMGVVVGFDRVVYAHDMRGEPLHDVRPVVAWDRAPSRPVTCDTVGLIAA